MGAIVDEGSRVVFDEPLVAWTPDASRWPYELRLAAAPTSPTCSAPTRAPWPPP